MPDATSPWEGQAAQALQQGQTLLFDPVGCLPENWGQDARAHFLALAVCVCPDNLEESREPEETCPPDQTVAPHTPPSTPVKLEEGERCGEGGTLREVGETPAGWVRGWQGAVGGKLRVVMSVSPVGCPVVWSDLACTPACPWSVSTPWPGLLCPGGRDDRTHLSCASLSLCCLRAGGGRAREYLLP